MAGFEIHTSIKCGDPIDAIAHEHNTMVELANDKDNKRARDYKNIATGLLEALTHLGYDVVTDSDGYIVTFAQADEEEMA